jgi:hypothetical protein
VQPTADDEIAGLPELRIEGLATADAARFRHPLLRAGGLPRSWPRGVIAAMRS